MYEIATLKTLPYLFVLLVPVHLSTAYLFYIMRTVNLVGKTFGRLTVIEPAEPYMYPSGRKRKTFLCKCECGEFKTFTQWCEILGIECKVAYSLFSRTGDIFLSLGIA